MGERDREGDERVRCGVVCLTHHSWREHKLTHKFTSMCLRKSAIKSNAKESCVFVLAVWKVFGRFVLWYVFFFVGCSVVKHVLKQHMETNIKKQSIG